MSTLYPLHKKPELLSPAGNMACFFAAVENGADAVYFGLKDFSARAGAQNFTLDDTSKAIAYAREKSVKVYITLNTLIKTCEMERAVDRLVALEELQPDALIIQDLGLLYLLQSQFPQFNLHASTQMTIHNLAGVRQLEKMGFKRVVLARELSLNEIKNISQNTSMEVEVFIHGALCYSYSGHCFFSSMLGGRSGNRGRCAQPCRMYYKSPSCDGGYLFSMKDLLALPQIDDLMTASVHSFKIEGRMKSPEYVAAATDMYRQAIDGILQDRDDAIHRIKTVFSRETTHAYLFQEGYQQRENNFLSHLCEGGERGVVTKSPEVQPDVEQLQNRGQVKPTDMINPSYPANMGSYAGEVIRSEKGCVVIKADAEIGVRDLLRVFEQVSANPALLYVKTIKVKGKRVFCVKAGEIAAIDSERQFMCGAKLFLISSQKVNEMFAPKIPKKLIPCKVSVEVVVKIRTDGISIHGTIKLLSFTKNYPMKPEKGISRVIGEEQTRDVFSRLGETPFALANIHTENPEKLFVPLSVLNDIRRDYFQDLSEALHKEREKRSEGIKKWVEEISCKSGNLNDKLAAGNMDAEGVRMLLKIDNLQYLNYIPLEKIYTIYIALTDEITNYLQNNSNAVDTLLKIKDKVVFSLPVILRDKGKSTGMYEDFKKVVLTLMTQGFRKFQLSNLGAMALFDEEDVQLYADYPLYCLNPLSAIKLRELGFTKHTLSPEDDKRNIQTLFSADAEVIVYQDTPLFISEACIWANMKKTCPGMNQCGFNRVTVENEHGDRFTAINNRCETVVVGERPFSIVHLIPELHDAGQRDFRIDLCYRDYTTEMIEDILRSFQKKSKIKNSMVGNLERGLS